MVPTHEQYLDCLRDNRLITTVSNHIVSRKHEVTTEQRVKVALRNSDDKRFILSDDITTLALGHYKIPGIRGEKNTPTEETDTCIVID